MTTKTTATTASSTRKVMLAAYGPLPSPSACRRRTRAQRPVVLPRTTVVLDGERLGDALQRSALGLHSQERLDEATGDHQGSPHEVAGRDRGDVLVSRRPLDEPAEEQRTADAADRRADRV